jgi:hypothetical protein
LQAYVIQNYDKISICQVNQWIPTSFVRVTTKTRWENNQNGYITFSSIQIYGCEHNQFFLLFLFHEPNPGKVVQTFSNQAETFSTDLFLENNLFIVLILFCALLTFSQGH